VYCACSDLEAVTERIYSCWNYGATNISLHRKTNSSFVEEEAAIGTTYMSKREYKSWSWILRRLKPEMSVLAKINTN
jgi:hypothetical protein